MIFTGAGKSLHRSTPVLSGGEVDECAVNQGSGRAVLVAGRAVVDLSPTSQHHFSHFPLRTDPDPSSRHLPMALQLRRLRATHRFARGAT